MSLTTDAGEYDSPPRGGNNNPAPRSSQNKAQLLEATMRNVPKLKELNYTQWKNVITNSIKNAKLWEYIDGSIEQPPEDNNNDLAKYFDEAGAVRNAILGSLEPRAQTYIEEALNPRDAWLTLEKKYLTAEAEVDKNLVSIESQLADLRLEEGGDVIEHIAEFCRMRYHLNGTRYSLDDQASISLLYRSLPPSYRQSALTPDGTEMKDFNALCARLNYLSQNPEPQVDASAAPVEDYASWGVPEDIKAFGLTGDKNPLLQGRAAVTCRDCLLKDHKAGTPECPQYEWRKELWGAEPREISPGAGNLGSGSPPEQSIPVNTRRLGYEFSEPTKVILDFDELGLKPNLRQYMNSLVPKPSEIQQCVILPIINGRNVHAQAPRSNGKTTALAISILQVVDTALPHAQALVFTATDGATTALQNTIYQLGQGLSARCYLCRSSDPLGGPSLTSLAGINSHHIFVGMPVYILGLLRRNIINMRKIRIVVLDDIDKLIEAGTEDQILEVYRHVPPLTQIVASSTIYSSSIAKAVAKILADPLQIIVHRNEGISIGTHFYVTVPAEKKPDVLLKSFSALQVSGVVLLCRDFTEASTVPILISRHHWDKQYGYYYLLESMEPNERESVIQSFTSRLQSSFGYSGDPVRRIALAATDAAWSTIQTSNMGVPLINYDVPHTVEDYVKRLDQWRLTDPSKSQLVITFVGADTDEIQVVRDLERRYGVHVAELLWDGRRLH